MVDDLLRVKRIDDDNVFTIDILVGGGLSVVGRDLLKSNLSFSVRSATGMAAHDWLQNQNGNRPSLHELHIPYVVGIVEIVVITVFSIAVAVSNNSGHNDEGHRDAVQNAGEALGAALEARETERQGNEDVGSSVASTD